jgi:Na+/proline symporter
MILSSFDWLIVIGSLVMTLAIGVIVTRRAGSSASEFFLSGRNMPWWLLGVSMVATTFSAGTPNLVTNMVRTEGVAGNWRWWAFLLTGMLTVFVYAKLWRRSGVMTDIEFYELRYSGRPAAFLRGFRAVYLGVLFNVMVMASAILAAIKIAGVMLNVSPVETILISSVITVIYSMLGGLTGVLLTDFVQFLIAMGGAIAAAVYVLTLKDVGGLSGLLVHPAVQGKLGMFPDFQNLDLAMSVFVIPLTIQWWAAWYPGAEPGGGGYIAQRMLAAKNEVHATGATLLFNMAHYALRPWPWILVALASLVVYPDLASLQEAFPRIDPHVVKDDLAYPAMMTLLPSGLRGLILASLIAAYMSTLSTHLNWGSSYVVNDVYKRFYRPAASDKELVRVGRVMTVFLMVLASILALWLSDALQAFEIILQIGAGTGLLFILRWFWWRINAAAEIAAMVVSFLVAVGFELFGPPGMSAWMKIVAGVAITTVSWLAVTFLTPPADDKTLRRFYRLTRPGGPGWQAVVDRAAADQDPIQESRPEWGVPREILCALIGCVAVYSAVFATGYWIYGDFPPAVIFTVLAIAASIVLMRTWSRVNAGSLEPVTEKGLL